MAESLGAHIVGFILHPPSPRAVTAAQAAAVETGGLIRAGVFVGQGASEITDIMDGARLDLAQLHGAQTPADAARVGPGRVMRVIWPERSGDMASMARELDMWRDHAALFLFDAGRSGGGHGRRIGAGGLRFLGLAERPCLLAGGLDAGAVAAIGALAAGDAGDAGRTGALCGFDINSGAESSPGVKDPRLMAEAAGAVLAVRLPGAPAGLEALAALRRRRPMGG